MQPSVAADPLEEQRALRLRALTRHVPFRAAAAIIDTAVCRRRHRGPGPLWLVSDGPPGYPAMELDLTSPFQRRLFYFPRAYWGRLMGLAFGRFLAATLKPGDVFLDVGANVGFYSLFAAARVGPAGRVISFEPDPTTFESLRRSLARNGFAWAEARNLALSDRDGELPFYVTAAGSAHSLVPEVPERAHRYSGQLRVPVARLDDLVGAGRVDLPRVDLIKIDVEGEEARTVAGMTAALARFGRPPVWAEVRGPQGSTRAPNTFPAVLAALEPLGYRPFLWDGSRRPVTASQVRKREDVLFLAGAPRD